MEERKRFLNSSSSSLVGRGEDVKDDVEEDVEEDVNEGVNEGVVEESERDVDGRNVLVASLLSPRKSDNCGGDVSGAVDAKDPCV